ASDRDPRTLEPHVAYHPHQPQPCRADPRRRRRCTGHPRRRGRHRGRCTQDDHARGRRREVELTTFRSDLDSVLASSGYELDDRDRVVPAQGTSLSDGDSVTLNRAKQITITVEGEEKTVWTTAATVEDALRQFAYSPDDVKVSASRSQRLPLDGMDLEV